MTADQIEAYFTAALARETRGLDPNNRPALKNRRQPHLTGQLSKFGVGALQSFSFLGTELKVISKVRSLAIYVTQEFAIRLTE